MMTTVSQIVINISGSLSLYYKFHNNNCFHYWLYINQFFNNINNCTLSHKKDTVGFSGYF